ncbi:MAG TPA: hypothetical protein VG826_34350 [Pirellulales bacterium]|nr:hypothetical protein [Pirellulales bacterium]
MSRRFQFSSRRLFACMSVLCLAALVFGNGVAEARGGKCGTPALIGFVEAWVICGAACGLLLAKTRRLARMLAS